MTLSPGTRLGPYEIVGQIGAGGMGEVFRAKDTKLGREVAIKVLPEGFAEDPDRLRRFQHEARTLASLSHPNVMQVFAAGEHEGAPYLVMELLEGETLRERLRGKAIPPKRAAELARDVANGLAAAHAKGILHRDLKPENIFLTKDGRVKVLDFGLAKTHGTVSGSKIETRTVSTALSEPGHVVGTSGYMSPEQVRGEPLDARSDLFSLGVVLWEMVTGARPFQRDSSLETMHAILKDDPPELDASLKVPPALERILHTCLAKAPEGRFHSAHDLAFALEGVSGADTSSTSGKALRLKPRVLPFAVAISLVLGLLIGLAVLALRPAQGHPIFSQITFRQGNVKSARFTPDGREILLSANWEDGQTYQIFNLKLAPLELNPTGLNNALIQAISPSGEVAMTFDLKQLAGDTWIGTLGLAQLGALAPKAIAPQVWSSDISSTGLVAIAQSLESLLWANRLECPPGHVRLNNHTWLTDLRFSADGRLLAFVEHPLPYDHGGHLSLLDLGTGRIRRLTKELPGVWGLAWRGKEVWYTATTSASRETNWDLWAVTLRGQERLVFSSPGDIFLWDIASDGRALLNHMAVCFRTYLLTEGPSSQRELTDGPEDNPLALSPDGTRFLYLHTNTSSISAAHSWNLFIRPLREGHSMFLGQTVLPLGRFSPDGTWVSAFQGDPVHPVLISTVNGEIRHLPNGGIKTYFFHTGWTPDGKALVLNGVLSDGTQGGFLQDVESGKLRPLGPEGATVTSLSPDGHSILAYTKEGQWHFQDEALPGHPQHAVSGISPDDMKRGWTSDGSRFLLCRYSGNAIQFFRFDPRTGNRELWKRFDYVGERLHFPGGQLLSADGKTLLLTNDYRASILYLAEGLK